MALNSKLKKYSILTAIPVISSLIAVYLLALVGRSEQCTVTIQNGTIIGMPAGTVNPDKNVCAYMGIPYAATPIGQLRFKAPQPASAWKENPLNATSHPNWCPQQVESIPPGVTISEDCLYLNVYVPQAQDNSSLTNLPVMIWIYGGSFRTGSSYTYTHSKLLSRGDVILVVIHYRLGMLGFLSTGDEASPGNYGLKDQAQAIRWVNENINAFGGNPNHVTLFGESAGAFSTIFQFLSPVNTGLIHRIIAHSGSVLSIWALDQTPKASAEILATRLGCPIHSSKAIVKCLQETEWERIIAEQTKYNSDSYINLSFPFATMTPVIEPDVPGAFITKEPLELLENGDIPDIPVILGTNKHEGSLFLARVFSIKYGPEGLDKDPEYLRNKIVPGVVKLLGVEESGNRAVASSLELAYFPGVERTSWNTTVPGLVDLFSVFVFKSSVQATAEILTKRNLNVYLYSFEHHSDNNLWPVFIGSGYNEIPVQHGVSHADDLIYMFDFETQLSAQDEQFSAVFCDLWLNFAIHGNPTPSPSKRYDTWPLYNSRDEPYLKLNVTPTAQYGYRNSWFPNNFERN